VLPLAAVLGVVLGGVRERSGSVLPGIVIHAANNAALMAMSYALTGWAARLPVWGAS
jgi:membrane protease YdiL (CAAX protease family)